MGGVGCMHPPCQVIIRGRQYPSIRAAARAERVQASAICRALETHGHADFVGLGYRKGIRKGNKNAIRKPVQIGPMKFESRADLARAIKWKPWKVSTVLGARGTQEQKDALMSAVMALQTRLAIGERQHERTAA